MTVPTVTAPTAPTAHPASSDRASPIKVQLRVQQDYTTNPKYSVLYWGREFTGKSYNVLSWQEAGPLLLIYFDTNSATVAGSIGPECIVIDNPSVQQFQSIIIPAIQKRDLTVLGSTDAERELLSRITVIGLDSVSNLGARVLRSMAGSDTGKLEYDDRSAFINQMRSWFLVMIGSRRPLNDHPGWHFVATVHENTRTDDEGRVTEVTPKIEGAFRLELAALFDTCLWTDSEVVTDAKTGLRSVNYVCHAIPPDRFRKAGDRIGGKRLRKLPPKFVGTYGSLVKLWGERENTNTKQETPK
jgi:hypothetical protein